MAVRTVNLGKAQRMVKRAEELLDPTSPISRDDVALAHALAALASALMALGEYGHVSDADLAQAEREETTGP